ncbi:MAG: DNA-processing protein DprA [Dehalococcoidia bacterium]|jgi:DNA processing protein|nr:DNA-processing protein DprA [Dehalococcoidia bacterium]
MNQIKYWISFQRIPGLGRMRLSLLENRFGDMGRAWTASGPELLAAGLETRVVSDIVSHRPHISPDEEVERLHRLGIQAVLYSDPSYPHRLLETYDYPPVLYVRGGLTRQDENCIAVVGTQRPTIYGRQVTEEIVSDLVANRVTIVSGLARGIDGVAHRTTLSRGGRTIAIFGCGVDQMYPAEHASLAKDIMSHGALVSDYPPGTPPHPELFPRRNRILSGLSLGVLVIEAGESSGALITARWALEQNREVFAVPGSVLSPNSRGTNRLIQEGAKLVSSHTDILKELNLIVSAPQMEFKGMAPLNETETSLMRHLSAEPCHIDQVCRLAGLPTAVVSSTLAILELKGLARLVGPMNYIAAREAREDYHVGVH